MLFKKEEENIQVSLDWLDSGFSEVAMNDLLYLVI